MSGSDSPDDELWFSVFNGAITTHLVANPAATESTSPASSAFASAPALTCNSSPTSNLAFALRVTFTRSLWPFKCLSSSPLPPLHFHPYQSEYIRVLQGALVVEIEGQLHRLSAGSSSDSDSGPGNPGDSGSGSGSGSSPNAPAASDAIEIPPWKAHRFYPPADFGGVEQIVLLLAGTEPTSAGEPELDRDSACRLDAMFFENWYAYQQDVWRRGGGALSTLQAMAMFDAGGSYICIPAWIPFSKPCAVALGVVLGRWLGGILGYQPYYKDWTSNWDDACRRMRRVIWWRRFATL
ncbi:hypothetical protein BDV19DRAFT_389721 [Aspergillus venezuelensis]